VGRKRREEGLLRIKQKMAHYDVRGVGSRFGPSGPTLDGNSLETGMAAEQFDRSRYVPVQVITDIKASPLVIRIKNADLCHIFMSLLLLRLPICVWVGSGAFLSELLFCAQPVKQFIAWRATARLEDFLRALPNFLDRRVSALGRFCWIVLTCRVALHSCFHCLVCCKARFSWSVNR